MRLTESTTLAQLIGNEGALERKFIPEVYKTFNIRHDLELQPIKLSEFKLHPLPAFTLFVSKDGLTAVGLADDPEHGYRRICVLSIRPSWAKPDKEFYSSNTQLNYLKREIRNTIGEITQVFVAHNATVSRAEKPIEDKNAISNFRSKVMQKLLPIIKRDTEQMMADLSGLATNFIKTHNFMRAVDMTKRLHSLKKYHLIAQADMYDHIDWVFIEDHMLKEAMKIPAVKKELITLRDRFELDNVSDLPIESIMSGDWEEYEDYDGEDGDSPKRVNNSREFFSRYLKSSKELSELLTFIKEALKKGKTDEDN